MNILTNGVGQVINIEPGQFGKKINVGPNPTLNYHRAWKIVQTFEVLKMLI